MATDDTDSALAIADERLETARSRAGVASLAAARAARLAAAVQKELAAEERARAEEASKAARLVARRSARSSAEPASSRTSAESTARLLQVTRSLAFDTELTSLQCWRPLITVSGREFEVPAALLAQHRDEEADQTARAFGFLALGSTLSPPSSSSTNSP